MAMARNIGERNPITYRGDPIPYERLGAHERSMVDSADSLDRIIAASCGWGEDVLCHDPCADVRQVIAVNSGRKTAHLSDLPKDVRKRIVPTMVEDEGGCLTEHMPSAEERFDAARACYAPEVLHKDPDPRVRAAVAANGNYLSELFDDESDMVRVQVARRGFALDEYSHDPCAEVRMAVAAAGHAHVLLAGDACANVRASVAAHTEDAGLIDTLSRDPETSVKCALARRGLAARRLSGIGQPTIVRLTLADADVPPEILEKLASDPDARVSATASRRLEGGTPPDNPQAEREMLAKCATARNAAPRQTHRKTI